MECSLCHDDIIRTGYAVAIPCGHVFHGICINKWMETNSVCSVCGIGIFTEKINPLFLPSTIGQDEKFKYTIPGITDKKDDKENFCTISVSEAPSGIITREPVIGTKRAICGGFTAIFLIVFIVIIIVEMNRRNNVLTSVKL
ncbi:hypothetical protein ACFFRR_004291 [Megaselia abdita]